jgi:hypothetical protein
MENDFTYEDIIDILSSNGVDLTNVKIELTNVVRKHTNLNLIHPVALKSLVRKISKRAMLNKNTSTIQIFTDGSCLQNDSKHPGTFGLVVIYNNKVLYEYSNHNEITTNNEMELSIKEYEGKDTFPAHVNKSPSLVVGKVVAKTTEPSTA